MNWWKIRNWWHRPQVIHMCCKPNIQLFYLRYWLKCTPPQYDRAWREIGKLLHNATWRAYWALRYWFPLRCNGNDGGWRTRLCDWMEYQARKGE